MPKRILLINPPVHDFTAYDLWMKPVGLLYVGALLEAAGHEVGLVDAMDRHHPAVRRRPSQAAAGKKQFGCGAYFGEEIGKPAIFARIRRTFKRFGLPPNALRAEIRSRPRPDLIAVTSVMTYWYPGVFEAVALAKEAFPGVPIVLGGIYATLCADHARAQSGADGVVAGPAERDLLEAVSPLLGRAPATAWERLRPAYHLVRRLESVSVLTSRGCPFRCSYCASRLLTGGFAQRDPEDVAEEIETYVRSRGISDIAFYDDALLVNAGSHLLEILRRLDERGVRARFHTPNGLHARLITPEVARRLRAANFCTLFLSFETANEARQRDTGGKVGNEDLRAAIRNLLAAGFSAPQLDVYILMGFPGQAVEEVADSIAFVHESGGRIRLVQFSPIPGTPEFERSAEALPAIRTEPLLHNKTAFHQLAGPFEAETYDALKTAVNTLNAAHDAGRRLSGREVAEALSRVQAARGAAGGAHRAFA